ncbi:MAG: ECF transporter S component [Bacillota bacterium]|nr:ECF transporter S component [Bacillota bacterium]
MKNEKTMQMILTALMTALIVVATIILIIPVSFTGGYIHLGDSMIFLSVLILGWKKGAVAAGCGAALADLIAGFAMWAPWTFCIKAVMAVIMGLVIFALQKRKKRTGLAVYGIAGMATAGLWMVAAYFVAGGLMYGSFAAAALGIPMDLLQFAVGFVIAALLAAALMKTPAAKYFAYKLPGKE